MHTTEWVLFENFFPDLMHFFKGEFLIGRVGYRGDKFAVNFIFSHLAHKNTMATNSRLAIMFGNAIGYKSGCYGALDEDIFYFFFAHVKI